MRRLITGINANGRSCIVGESDVIPGAIEGASGVETASLWSTEQNPPPSRPEQPGHFIDVRLEPGYARWIVVDHAAHDVDSGPTTASQMHHSDTLDLILVLEGSTRLVLEDDVRDLRPGDCVIMTGVDHAFEAGPDGCRVVSVAIGTPPPG